METSGHSGRYWADITDTLIAGRFTQWNEGVTTPRIYGPGDTVPHPPWSATGVCWTGGTWMVEYARGAIPTTMPFAFADGLLSAQDIWSLGKSVLVYARHLIRNTAAGWL